MNVIFFVIILALEFINLCSTSILDKKDYGPFNMDYKYVELCQGPKKKDCAKSSISVNRTKETTVLTVTLNITESCALSHAKIVVVSLKSGGKKKLLDHNINNPCQHFLFGPVLIDEFKMPNNCIFPKGIFSSSVDATEKGKIFLGPNFFYGDYDIKAVFTNKKTNLCCFRMTLSLEKQT